MTRAEDELYVTGTLTKDGKLDGTWYEAIETALRPESEIVMDADGAETALIYPHQRPAPLAVSDAVDSVAAATASLDLTPLPPPRIVPVVSPSSAFVAANPLQVYDTALDASVDAEAARKEGLALHALLQHLGKVERSVWPMVIDKAMPVLLPDGAERHAPLAGKARRILDNPKFAHIFGPYSRAEVPFLANARRNDTSIRLAGRIDRLVVTGTEVLLVDYKSDAQVPETSDDVPPAYLTQLGLYALVASQLFPAHTVAAAILWTTMESLMILPLEKLRQATAAFTME
jgi:ATP-dependent helicase/nuclease subunit A